MKKYMLLIERTWYDRKKDKFKGAYMLRVAIVEDMACERQNLHVFLQQHQAKKMFRLKFLNTVMAQSCSPIILRDWICF